MAPRYSPPSSVEAISEAADGESRGDVKRNESPAETIISSRRHEHRYDTTMTVGRTSSDRHREKSRRSHRPSSLVSSRSSTTGKSKPASKRVALTIARDEVPVEQRLRHRRTRSHHSGNSCSSSSDDGDVPEGHHAVLAAARERLTSPSVISTLTSLTTATNNSGSSSGSNSTVTQTSLSRELTLERLQPTLEAPMSPAVPDPPDVFSFLEQDSPNEDEEEEEDDDDDDEEHASHIEPQWLGEGIYEDSSLPCHPSPSLHESRSSSGSSSFHSDYTGSEPAADNETDRSTSPERSVKGEDDTGRPDAGPPNDPAASKLASQMLAAQHRQSLHSAFQSLGAPQMPRGKAVHPHVPSTALSPRMPQQMHHRSPPPAEKLPITGYEALATKLSSHGAKSAGIKPIYRKFERLNHRLLLHLQDELTELEEQLHRLDSADTQSRSMHGAKPGEIRIFPASRRAAAHAGGELEWCKMDLINRIAYKLGQYNQALTSFNKLSQNLGPPELSSIKQYRAYLKSEQPVMETETRFLEASGDLVTFGRKPMAAIEAPRKPPSEPSNTAGALATFHIIALAVAVAVLLPILTFSVIPGLLGRMTVVTLVASGAVGALVQSGVTGRAATDWERMAKEWGSCAAIYGAVMVIVAGVVS